MTPLGHWRRITTDTHGVEYVGDCCDGLCEGPYMALTPTVVCCQVCGTVGSPPARVGDCQSLLHVQARG